MNIRRNRKLDTLSDRLYRASPNTEQAFNHLNEQRANVPTLKVASYEPGRTGTGSHSDRTAATAQQLAHIEYRRTTITDAIATLELATDHLDQAIRDAYQGDTIDLEQPTTDDRPLCRGGQPDTWGDPDCGELVDSFPRGDGTIGYRGDGLCVKHRSAKRRWEHNQNQDVA